MTIGSMPRAGERGDRREADRAGPDDERDLTGDDARHRDVALADRERVGQGDRVGVGVARHRPGDQLAHEEQLTEAARARRDAGRSPACPPTGAGWGCS